MPNQTEKFIEKEADEWFLRNKLILNKNLKGVYNIPINMIINILKKGDFILEIGCSNGRNLNEIFLKTEGNCFGIDPSNIAILEGKKMFPKINLNFGIANDLNFENQKFDVVWFGFCMYLIDRSLLMKAVSEADRVLKENGFLVITDFDPIYPFRNKYLDMDQIHSYKADYSKLFLGNPSYSLVEKKSYSHKSSCFHRDENQRIATWILNKSILNGYAERANS